MANMQKKNGEIPAECQSHANSAELDTAKVHTGCCDGHLTPDKEKRPEPPVYWPHEFTMDWNMYLVANCTGNPLCGKPPYSSDPMTAFKNSPGSTYTNMNYKNGPAQREEYKERCIPIWY
jgi:hypothetical protein